MKIVNLEENIHDHEAYLPEHPGCCCKCKFLMELYSHPWVDGKPTSHRLGYACGVRAMLKETPRDPNHITINNRHGLCELFTEKYGE